MASLPTVLVFDTNREMECLINESDFDPAVHKAVDPAFATAADANAAKAEVPAFNPKPVLRGKIPVITARIKEVAEADLSALRDAEVAGKARSPVLAAIDEAAGFRR